MNLDEAKSILEELGIAEEITKELVEASSVILDALADLESRVPYSDSVTSEVIAPEAAADESGMVDGCSCSMCNSIRRQRGEPEVHNYTSTWDTLDEIF